MPFFATGLSVMNDSTYLFNSVDADNTHLGDCINYAMLMTDSALIIKKKGFFREYGKYSSVWIPDNFTRQGNHTFFHPAFDDVIYSIDTSGELRPVYKVDFGSHTLPEKYKLSSNWSQFTKESTQKAYWLFPGKYELSDNWLLFEFLDNHITKYCFYNAISKNNCHQRIH